MKLQLLSVITPGFFGSTRARLSRTGELLGWSAFLIACCAPAGMAVADPPLAVVNGHAVTATELNAELDRGYREAALRRLVTRRVVDDLARAAGVSITEADVDSAVSRLRSEKYGSSDQLYRAALAREGLTPLLYREVLRQGMIADAIVSRPTRLTEADYDQIRAIPIRVASPTEAGQVLAALHSIPESVLRSIQDPVNGDAALSRYVQQFGAQILPGVDILRYDERFSASALQMLFNQVRVGECSLPVPAPDGDGYLLLKVVQRRMGKGMAAPDREVWSRFLLQQKIKMSLQDWWADVEKQVSAALEKTSLSEAAAPAAPAGSGDGLVIQPVHKTP